MEYTENPLAFGERGNNKALLLSALSTALQYNLQSNQSSELTLSLLAERPNLSALDFFPTIFRVFRGLGVYAL